uniref:Ribosome maturation factor RimP n=1 Tax=candidate division WOR-3 bacterium TaxID=2052148 RepID=A0A7C4XLU0_UNCW3
MAEIDLNSITERVKLILKDMNFRLYDIQFNKVSRVLRIFIDREDSSVTIRDCEVVSNEISQELDRMDIINFPYTLEVSSPGIERQLTRPEHYHWALGKLIEIRLKDREIRGYLREVRNEGPVLALKSGESLIPYEQIIKARVIQEY